MATRRPHPAPVRTQHDEPFWEAASRGVLALKRCTDCGRPHWYPRRRCPFCGSDATVWEDASGRGTIHSFSLVSRSRRPSAVAIVELDEGPRLTGLVADCDVHRLRIGDEVRVGFEAAEDGSALPVFTTPAADRARAYAEATLAASAQVPGVDPASARSVEAVAVVGAGTMGSGIAKALLGAGLRVVLIDPDGSARERAAADIAGHLERVGAEATGFSIRSDLADAAGVDLAIEAVWEQRSLKRRILAELAEVTGADCVLATNTSSIDVDDLAGATPCAERVLGLHFFSPAHVMRLVEVVRGRRTDPAVLATALGLVRRIGKTPVVVGVCHGFVGNRMMFARNRQAEALLLEGALPDQVDRVMRETGLPMGPFEMLDLGGAIELSVRRRQESGEENWLVDELYRRGHRGQRSGLGWYRYEQGDRRPRPDAGVAAVIAEASARAGIERRRLEDAEIADRLLLPMVNEGFRLLEEGVVERPGDIDVVWRYGYGWPDWSGGPMYHAETLGLGAVVDRLSALAQRHGADFEPAPLLVRLAAQGAGPAAPGRPVTSGAAR